MLLDLGPLTLHGTSKSKSSGSAEKVIALVRRLFGKVRAISICAALDFVRDSAVGTGPAQIREYTVRAFRMATLTPTPNNRQRCAVPLPATRHWLCRRPSPAAKRTAYAGCLASKSQALIPFRRFIDQATSTWHVMKNL